MVCCITIRAVNGCQTAMLLIRSSTLPKKSPSVTSSGTNSPTLEHVYTDYPTLLATKHDMRFKSLVMATLSQITMPKQTDIGTANKAYGKDSVTTDDGAASVQVQTDAATPTIVTSLKSESEGYAQ